MFGAVGSVLSKLFGGAKPQPQPPRPAPQAPQTPRVNLGQLVNALKPVLRQDAQQYRSNPQYRLQRDIQNFDLQAPERQLDTYKRAETAKLSQALNTGRINRNQFLAAMQSVTNAGAPQMRAQDLVDQRTPARMGYDAVIKPTVDSAQRAGTMISATPLNPGPKPQDIIENTANRYYKALIQKGVNPQQAADMAAGIREQGYKKLLGEAGIGINDSKATIGRKAVGDIAGTALNVAPVGQVGKEAALLKKMFAGAKLGAGGGVLAGVAQDNATPLSVAQQALSGAVLGGAIPVAGQGIKNLPKGAKAVADDTAFQPRQYRISKNERYNLADYADYQMKMYKPKGKELNQLINDARATGKKIGVDVTSGSAVEIRDRIAEFLDDFDQFNPQSGSVRVGKGQPELPPQNQPLGRKAKVNASSKDSVAPELSRAEVKQGISDGILDPNTPLPSKARTTARQSQAIAQERLDNPQSLPNPSQATRNAVDSTTNTPQTPQISQQVEASPALNQKQSNTFAGSKPQRAFKVNMSKDVETPFKVYKDVPGYGVKTNKETIGKATQRVSADPEATYDRLIQNGAKTLDDKADALVLLRNLVEKDELDKAAKLANATAKSGTEAGQAVQIFSAYRKTTPDGALRDIYARVNDFNTKNPKRKPVTVTKEQAKNIVKLAEEIQKLEPNSREWAVKAAQLEREKGLVIPSSFLSKVSQVQTMSQLLNPKTFIRNVIGNTALDLGEDGSRAVAAGIDKALTKLGVLDQRHAVLPSLKANWLNKVAGFKHGAEDVKLGIRTTGATGKYDLSRELFKPGSVGNKLEKLLGYELSAFDKAFFTGRYQASIANLKKAMKTDIVSAEMRLMAEQEALYSTFQNNSAIADALVRVKKGLNAGKEWGVGDLILKYPKTPGNIVSVGLDYSPVGFVKGLKKLYDGVKLDDFSSVRGGEIDLGRSLVGSGMIMGGAILAKQGIITGKKDSDYDKAAADRMTGQGPFSFNITALGRFLKGENTGTRPGDISANYDWLQPSAIQLTMGANMILNKDNADQQINASLESLGSGLDTISEQPVFQGVKRFTGNLDSSKGGGAGKAIGGLLVDTPSSFVPSAVNQLGQMTDNTRRDTYDPGMTQQALNKIKQRLPWVRKSLQPSLNTLGQEQKQFDVGGNNPLNIFLNPAFLTRVSNNKSIKLSDDLNKSTGEVSQYPRGVDTKIKVNGEDKKLSGKEKRDYQRFVGTNTDAIYQKIQDDPRFKKLNDTDKVKVLQNLQTDINSAAKIKLFGDSPDKISESVQSIIDNNTLRPIELKLTAKEKAEARAKAPKVAKIKKAKVAKAKKVKVAKAKTGRKTGAGSRGGTKVGVPKPKKISLKIAKAPNIKAKKFKVGKLKSFASRSKKTVKIG